MWAENVKNVRIAQSIQTHVQDRKKFRKFKRMPRSVFICDLDQLSKLHVLEKQEILKCSFGVAWWQRASELNQTALFAGNLFKKN